jgi:hypothetical protein
MRCALKMTSSLLICQIPVEVLILQAHTCAEYTPPGNGKILYVPELIRFRWHYKRCLEIYEMENFAVTLFPESKIVNN